MTLQSRKRFQKRLRLIAKKMNHDTLAIAIGVSRDLMRNWIYRDLPQALAAEKYGPKLDEIIASTRKPKQEQNQ